MRLLKRDWTPGESNAPIASMAAIDRMKIAPTIALCARKARPARKPTVTSWRTIIAIRETRLYIMKAGRKPCPGRFARAERTNAAASRRTATECIAIETDKSGRGAMHHTKDCGGRREKADGHDGDHLVVEKAPLGHRPGKHGINEFRDRLENTGRKNQNRAAGEHTPCSAPSLAGHECGEGQRACKVQQIRNEIAERKRQNSPFRNLLP